MWPHGSNFTEGGSSQQTTHCDSSPSPLWGISWNDSTTACIKKTGKKKRRTNVQGRSFTKSANISEWQKRPCITLQTKHFLNIAAQSMQANTWPQGSNLASAVLPHKRHFTSVSLLTADNDLAWAESVSSREGGVASSGFLADALMVNRSMNWVKKEQPSFTTTPLIAPKSSKRHKGLFFSQTRENGR